MTKNLYICHAIHQSLKLHGTHSLGFESFRRTLVVFMMVTVSVLTSLAQTPLNESDVYSRLISRQYMEGYTEGTPWDNSHLYINQVEFDGYPAGWYTGAGCFAFMMDMMEYASNYEYPIRIIHGEPFNLPKIHVGDGIRLNNDNHSVVVLEVDTDGHNVVVAEGNFNSSVHWGRAIDLANPANGFVYVATFWPEEEEPAEPEIITIGESGYATFYYPKSAYIIPEGVEAMAVENVSGRHINFLTLDGIIPEGHAVILEGEPGDYTFEPIQAEGTFVENMLRGTEEWSLIELEEQECKYYMLSIKNGRVGFYYGADDGGVFMNDPHKAYLPVPVSQSEGINSFFFDEATSIDNMLTTDKNADRAIYNLSGQRVSDSYKGVVIVNGKKVLRK